AQHTGRQTDCGPARATSIMGQQEVVYALSIAGAQPLAKHFYARASAAGGRRQSPHADVGAVPLPRPAGGVQTAAFTNAVSCAFERAPTWVPLSLPLRNSISVGMPRTPYWAATSRLASTSTLHTFSRPA